MTPEDKDAALGRAVRAKSEGIKRLAELRSHAAHIGAQFSTLGAMLVSEPENIQFEGEPEIKAKSTFHQLAPFRFSVFDAHEVAALAGEIRTATLDLERLTSEAAKYGF